MSNTVYIKCEVWISKFERKNKHDDIYIKPHLCAEKSILENLQDLRSLNERKSNFFFVKSSVKCIKPHTSY